MIFINAQYPNKDFIMTKGDIEFNDGKIVRLAKSLSYNPQDMVVNCEGFFVIPAYVNTNCYGEDFTNDDIAQASLSMHKDFLNLLENGVPMGQAVKKLCYDPCLSLGIETKVGTIEVGKNSNLIVLDSKLNVVAVEFCNK